MNKIIKNIFFVFSQLNYYYQLLLRRTLQGSVRYSAILIAAFILTFFSACNNKDTSSPFSEILAQPLYAPLTDSIKKQPNNDELYFRRAVLLNKNNLPEPALADFQKAWSLSKHEKYAYGVTNVWIDKKPDSAVVFLHSALKELPESFLLRLSLARAYDGLNKTDNALKVCEEILQVMPDQPDVLLLQSELLQKKGDTQGAITALEKVYRLVPLNMDLAFRLAYQYAETKNPKTLSFCDSLIQKDSLKLHADPYYVKGLYYSNINNKAKAIQLFDETIKHSYNYLNAYVEKGKILVEQKKTVEAYKVFNLANTIKPAFPDAYYWMGICQEALGQTDEAKMSYEKAYSLDKTFIEAKEAAERIGN